MEEYLNEARWLSVGSALSGSSSKAPRASEEDLWDPLLCEEIGALNKLAVVVNAQREDIARFYQDFISRCAGPSLKEAVKAAEVSVCSATRRCPRGSLQRFVGSGGRNAAIPKIRGIPSKHRNLW